MQDVLSKYLGFLRFQVSRRLDSPSFNYSGLLFHSEQENEYFREKLLQAQGYLEFGSGASTVCAADFNIPTITIESDSVFLRSVLESCGGAGGCINAVHRDIGALGPWGSPFISAITPLTKSRLKCFGRYSDPPAELFDKGDIALPDLVLIDGKFRVACALKLLKFFQASSHEKYRLIIDDYVGRSQYHILERYFKLHHKFVEFAVFGHPNFIPKTLEADIEKYSCDPD